MKIVVVSPMQPFEGIGNAGGLLLQRHLVELSKAHEVTLLVAGDAWHEYSVDVERASVFASLQLPSRAEGPVRAAVSRVLRKAFPVECLRGMWSAVATQPAAERLLFEADLIEVHWFETLVALAELRKAGVEAEVSAYFHDVVSQKVRRQFVAAEGVWRKTVVGLRLAQVRRLERRLLPDVDQVICLSEKDEQLLVDAGAAPHRVHVLRPPLTEPGMPDEPPNLTDRALRALFVADFGRDDNEDAAFWLLREVWPRVMSRVPQASLVLAGGRVSEALQQAVSQAPTVSTTGYVTSLDSAYLSCRVALSPVHSGAGVKFKSVVPMLWGVPVVSTSIGAEGIPGGWFTAVADDAEHFADALARVLTEPGSADGTRADAFAGSRATCSAQAYERQVRKVYGR